MAGGGDYCFVAFESARQRLCDGWKKRPKTWKIYSEGPKSNPHWFDPYISRATQHRLRGQKIDAVGDKKALDNYFKKMEEK